MKEIHYIFENIEPKIKGRIYKIILGANAKYTWEVNFFGRLKDEYDAYVPSAPFVNSLEEIENKIFQYVKRFQSAIDCKPNDYF